MIIKSDGTEFVPFRAAAYENGGMEADLGNVHSLRRTLPLRKADMDE